MNNFFNCIMNTNCFINSNITITIFTGKSWVLANISAKKTLKT